MEAFINSSSENNPQTSLLCGFDQESRSTLFSCGDSLGVIGFLFVKSSSAQASGVSTGVTAAALELRQGAELELPDLITVSGTVSALPYSASWRGVASTCSDALWWPSLYAGAHM